jgi:methyl-accepting chemotaxis protein
MNDEPYPELAQAAPNGVENNPPKPKLQGDSRIKGSPTTPRAARGVMKDTTIDRMSNRLAHHCDFGINLSRRIGLKKYIKAMMTAIREGIRAIKRFLGLGDPSGVISTIINKVKAIVQEIKYYVNTYIKPIAKFLIKVIKFIRFIKTVIAWILGLPARFLKYLRQCLTALMSAIGKIFMDTLFESEGDSTIGKDIQDIMKDAKEIVSTVSTTINLANQTVAEVQSLGNLTSSRLDRSTRSVSGAGTLTESQNTLTQMATSETANNASNTIIAFVSTMPTTANIANTVTTATSSIPSSPNTSTV